MNILLAINSNYVSQTKVLLKSIIKSNPNVVYDVYILYKELKKQEKELILSSVKNSNIEIHFIKIDNKEINNFPVYEKRYPIEIYFRLFASKYLPKTIDKILYLDVDTVVINSLSELYTMDFENNLFIGATHIRNGLHKFHSMRLNVNEKNIYVNTGVLLMNLKELRNIPVEKEVIYFIKKNKNKLLLPDQDIIYALYGDRVKEVSPLLYNLGDKGLRLHNLNKKNKIDIDWVRKNTVVIHYYGRNKPWNKNYDGILNVFYDEII